MMIACYLLHAMQRFFDILYDVTHHITYQKQCYMGIPFNIFAGNQLLWLGEYAFKTLCWYLPDTLTHCDQVATHGVGGLVQYWFR